MNCLSWKRNKHSAKIKMCAEIPRVSVKILNCFSSLRQVGWNACSKNEKVMVVPWGFGPKREERKCVCESV